MSITYLNPVPKPEDLYGWVGGILALIYNIPQIYKICRNKSASDISMPSWLMRSTSYIFYIIHTFINKDSALFYTYLLGFIQVLIITLLIYIYGKDNNKKNETELQYRESPKQVQSPRGGREFIPRRELV